MCAAAAASGADGGKASASEVPQSATEEKRRLWMAAIKPPMYSVGVIPVMVAAAAVFAETGCAPWLRLGGFLLAAILVIAWLNLSNDAFDAATGVDKSKRESVVNLTGNRTGVLVAANALLLGGVSLLYALLAGGGDARPAAMLAGAIACGYVYQGPPFRLSYKGLGEPLCFVAFGPLATPAFYLALLPPLAGAGAGSAAAAAGAAAAAAAGAAAAAAPVAVAVPPTVWALSALVGITTTVILFCSHFHQIDGDIAAGKRSPLVRLGTERATAVLLAATTAPYVLLVAAAVEGVLPLALIPATALSLPSALALYRFAADNHTEPKAIAPLKIFATKLHMAFGLALVIGLWASRQLA
ncbi:hypothetical protein FOA52_011769 [Chlamydomonas sp. UWO 241]|nr:hypothetical protein FOA52_011769 [Chlamydomonas sp. UWO 241]